MTFQGFEGLVLPELALMAGSDRLAVTATCPDIDPCTATGFGDIPVASASDVDQIVERVNRIPVRFALFFASTLCLFVLALLAVIATLG